MSWKRRRSIVGKEKDEGFFSPCYFFLTFFHFHFSGSFFFFYIFRYIFLFFARKHWRAGEGVRRVSEHIGLPFFFLSSLSSLFSFL